MTHEAQIHKCVIISWSVMSCSNKCCLFPRCNGSWAVVFASLASLVTVVPQMNTYHAFGFPKAVLSAHLPSETMPHLSFLGVIKFSESTTPVWGYQTTKQVACQIYLWTLSRHHVFGKSSAT